MMIATLLETGYETRVAITPNAAKQYIKLGFEVAIEKNAGIASGFANNDYEQVGVQINNSKKTLLKQTNILLCINEPDPKDLAAYLKML